MGLIRAAELVASCSAAVASDRDVEQYRSDLEWLVVRGLITAGQAEGLIGLVGDGAGGSCP